MKIEDIKSPQDILTFMNENIEYGWLDKENNKHIKTMKNFRKLYKTSSIKETLENGVGCCIEQVYLTHCLLDKLNIKNKMFCCRIYEPDNYNNLEEDEHMHCFILYYQNNKVYQIEHPNFHRIGIYEFNSEKDAINTIVSYYINLSGGKERPTTQFYDVPVGISFKEFNNYINSLDVKKILTFIVNENNQFLLLKGNKNDPQFHKSFWYVVTGSCEKEDNNQIETVKREVKEETNLDVIETKYLNKVFHYQSLGKNCIEYVYLSKVKKDNIILNEENIDYKWCDFDEFIELIDWFEDKKELISLLNNI